MVSEGGLEGKMKGRILYQWLCPAWTDKTPNISLIQDGSVPLPAVPGYFPGPPGPSAS